MGQLHYYASYLEKVSLYAILDSIMLSSDILEQQFGPTELVIIFQDTKYRVIQTITSGDKTVLEISLVTFDQLNARTFADIHHTITNGESMGKAFKQAGVKFLRDVNYISHVAVPPTIQNQFGQDDRATAVDVDILVGPDKLHYCHIIEIYSPSVAWPTDTTTSPSETPDLAF